MASPDVTSLLLSEWTLLASSHPCSSLWMTVGVEETTYDVSRIIPRVELDDVYGSSSDRILARSCALSFRPVRHKKKKIWKKKMTSVFQSNLDKIKYRDCVPDRLAAAVAERTGNFRNCAAQHRIPCCSDRQLGPVTNQQI